MTRKCIWRLLDRFLFISCIIVFLLLYFGSLLISSGMTKIRESKKQFLILKLKSPQCKTKHLGRYIIVLSLDYIGFHAMGKGRKQGLCRLGWCQHQEMTKLCANQSPMLLSCGMPGTEAISGHYPVSSLMSSIHCLDWEAVRSSFCFHWGRSPINSSHQLACLPSRRIEALRFCLTFKLSSVNRLISWPRICFSQRSKDYGSMYLVRKWWEAVSISQGPCRKKSTLN